MREKHLNFLTPNQPVCQLSLNMQTPIYPNTLKVYSEKLDGLLADLEDKFSWQPVHPKEDLPSIMYRAGQQSVVQYVKQQLEDE
jgi:hypothetical protein